MAFSLSVGETDFDPLLVNTTLSALYVHGVFFPVFPET